MSDNIDVRYRLIAKLVENPEIAFPLLIKTIFLATFLHASIVKKITNIQFDAFVAYNLSHIREILPTFVIQR